MKPVSVLRGLRLLSLALNLPGPVALARCRSLGARCRKWEPPGGDALAHYQPAAYAELHAGVRVRRVDLKAQAGQRALQRALADTDVLLTSFRPSALARLGLTAHALRRAHPHLAWVQILGSTAAPEAPGHDLLYQAEQGLLPERGLPVTLLADLGGAEQAVQAVLQAALAKARGRPGGVWTVGLADAARALAAPRRWGLTTRGGLLGGGHAGYARWPCADGEVLLAALEPHFAARLARCAGLPEGVDWRSEAAAQALHTWLRSQTCAALFALAQTQDLPLWVNPEGAAGPD